MTLQLRQGCVTDLPAIYLGEESYIRCWEPGHEAAWRSQMERHLTLWIGNLDRLTVAVMEGQFAGYGFWAPEHRYAELCSVHVRPAYRRLGVGKALLDAYLCDAARQGFRHFRLSVRPDNPAKFMYQTAGFSCTDTGRNDYLTYERQA